MYYKNEYKNRFRILKGGLISLVVASNLYGAPSGGTVVSGNATISQNANTTNINQSSNKTIINWQDFSIKSNETVNFNQPNVNSITLNRVIGNEKSIIDGALNANGQVWLINSNGVLFGKNAKVNTAGIVASTKDISNEDFNKGNYNFKGNSTSSIVNEGEIKSLANTHATFIANSVTNKGKIEVHKGTINLVGASDVTLTLNENQNLSLKVNKGVLDALVDNQNLIVANGGNVYLTTNAKDELLKGVVNHSGIIEASSIDELTQSEVILFAHGGTTNVDGSIIAKNSFVETSGEKLNVTSNTKVIAKDWLLDPTDILIESTGGNDLTGDSVSATAIQNNLETTNVHLQATNNITVNQNITWSTDKQLKLEADNINVNATINNTNQTNGGVYFQAANTTDKVVFDTNGKVIVNNLYQLQWINRALNGKYELGRDIDAGATKTDTANWGIEGWNPIGNFSNRFTGTFDGLGFAISNLYINRPDTNFVGLFGYTNNATIKNIGLKNVGITGENYTGGLVGYNEGGTISNSYATGTVSGHSSGGSYVGGLVGYNANSGTISNSYATGTVGGDSSGGSYVGGLVGENVGTITNSYATGTVGGGSGGRSYAGGFVGYNANSGTITNSYATGTVSGHSGGRSYVGGFVGENVGTITNSYATGTVGGGSGGRSYAGGLVGYNANSGTITNSYATGTVSGHSGGRSYVGGLVGWNDAGTILTSFYDNETNTASMDDSSYGKTKAEIATALKNASSEWETDLSKGRGYGTGGTTALPFLKNVTKLSNTLFEDGFGTTLNPYKITNWTQLQNINNSNILTQNYYFNLLNNINSSTTGYMGSSGEGWNPIGGSIGFQGTFDGKGFTISDLYINRPTQSDIGLFGYTSYATIKNIGLENLSIVGKSSVGGLVGENYATITNSYASGTVSGNSKVGGLVGLNYETITNSYASGTVSGDNNVGGLVGLNNYATITNSYALGSVNGAFNVGGLVGENYATITNSYASGTVSGNSQVGGLVGLNYATITNSYYDKEANTNSMNDSSYGETKEEILEAFKGKDGWITGGYDFEGFGILSTNPTLPELRIFTTIIPTKKLFEDGFGTEVNPYKITNWTQLQNINNSNILTQNYYFNLLNNLSSSTSDYTNLASNTANSGLGWNPIGNDTNKFNGTFDGKGFTISDLYINRPSQRYIGLFGYVNTGSIIKDIGLENINIKGQYYVSGLVGWNYEGNITNSYVTGDVSGNLYIGGLVGFNENGTISNSYATGSVNGNYTIGGLVGYSYGTISNSYATGSVNGNSEVGGLVGYNDGTISNSYASGNVNGFNYVGGLVGYNYSGTISNSFYDKTKYTGNGVGYGNQNGVTGKTTQEMSYGGIFETAGWDIVADSSVISLTPILKYDSVNNKYVWAIAPINLNYSLGTRYSTYNGLSQELSSFYTSSSIFGNSYDFLQANDYKFVDVNNNDITGYKDAGTYSNIKVASNNDFLTIASSGNTDGTFDINKAQLDIVANSDSKVYNGDVQSVNGYTFGTNKLLENDTEADLTLSGTTTTSSSKNVGTTKTNISGTSNNYNINFTQGNLEITKADATVTVNSDSVVYNGLTQNVNGFTVSGLVNNETKDVLTGLTGLTTSGKNAGSYNTNLGGDDINYNLNFVQGELEITKANATVTANSDSVVYNGLTQNVNGFTVSGLVNNETKDVLTGLTGLTTSGKNAGTYNTNLSGTDTNYNLIFVNGKLTINKKDLTISNITANNKIYDGTTTATLSNIGTLDGLVTGEDLVLNNPTSVIFSSKDVADGIVVTATGYTIADKDSFKASNYNLIDTSKTTTANIVASVNPTPTVDEKVQRVIASIEPSTNSNSSSNQSVPNSLNINIRTLSFNGVDETRVINGGVRVPDDIVNSLDEL
ncbi:GLUG motif-containing protein [Aliarcobacter cryaerophilus]|uniref:GLUG motif-containing protein n=1 Tax=Aliarcobacter cryaerophilus TaxID=28198 RepID=UPI0021B6CCF4|nr:GLUG motif-containing protein [Aliarcobacter cryaerophilus]MCT7481313.1 filamentous hemagglutinin N-terminal domain-containing protein [Aliarcobacter cryaerophilus]